MTATPSLTFATFIPQGECWTVMATISQRTSRMRFGQIFIRETEAELGEVGTKSLIGQPFEEWSAAHFVGIPEQVGEKMQSYTDRGCKGFVPWCADFPDDETMRLYAKVMNHLRQANGSRK